MSTWTNGSGGDWSVGSNWSPSGVPGSPDDVLIDLFGTPYIVTINFAQSAQSLTLNSTDATVQLNNSLTIGTTLTLNAGAFNLNSTGTIVGGTIIGTGMVFQGGTLSGVTYEDALDLSAAGARVNVSNGITLTGAGGSGSGNILLTGNGSDIYFRGNQTFDNATVSIGGSSSTAAINQTGTATTLTLGPNLAITHAGKYAQIYGLRGVVVNAGTIDAGFSGGTFLLDGGTFINQGLISVSNGDKLNASFRLTFANQGTIALATGGELHFAGRVSQTDPSRSIGYISNTGGTVFIDGTLDNAGGVLTTGIGGIGAVALPGLIAGGTVNGSGMVFQDGTLSGVTYAGTLDLSASGAKVNIRNGISLVGAGGSGPGSVLLTGNNSGMYFYNSLTLDAASFSIGGASSYARLVQEGGGGTLNLGPDLTIIHAGSRAQLYIANYNSIVNAGLIDAGLSSGRFLIYGDGAFTNTGAISVSNGDVFRVSSYGGFANQGSITLASGARLELATALTTAEIGAVTNTGGTISIQRTLDNTGSVLATGPAGLGTVAINAGQIVGGTITGSGMQFFGGGMSGVTFVGPLDLSANGAGTAISNGITLVGAGGSGPGSVQVTGNLSTLTFTGTQSLDNASIAIGGSTAYSFLRPAGGTVSLGPSLSITQTGLYAAFYLAGAGRIVNAGTIDAGASGGRFNIYGTGGLTNLGTIGVSNGDTFLVGSTVTGTGTFTVNGNAYLSMSRDVAIGQTIDFGGSAGHLVLNQPSTFDAGVIGFENGDTIDFQAIGLAVSYTFSGGILALYNVGGAQIADVSLSTPVTNPVFTLATDGSTGTLLGISPSSAGIVYSGTYTSGIVLSNPTTQIPATVTSGGYVINNTALYNGDAVYGTNAAAWTLSNYGTINATAAYADGIDLVAGGFVANQAGALIAGSLRGVVIGNAPGTIANDGTISGAAGYGIYFGAGGTVSNSGLVTGATDVVLIRTAAAMVANSGTIVGTAGPGIWLAEGGTVINDGLVTGSGDVVFTGYAGGVVANSGTIANTGASGDGVCLDGGGLVTNALTGIIIGADIGIESQNAAGTVVNLGTITATGTYSTGIWLINGGAVTNGQSGSAGGLITGGADGVVIGTYADGDGTLINHGTIDGPNLAVWLAAGGLVANYGTLASLGTYGDGVAISTSAGTVVNAGVIVANNLGVWMQAGGQVINGPGGAAAASITGVTNGIVIAGGSGAVANYGTIGASGTYGASIFLADGGSVTNEASGSIIGASNAVAIFFAPGAVTNLGTIAAIGSAGYGAVLSDGGIVINYGSILEAGTSGAGIRVGAGGYVANRQGAIIEGADGVQILGGTGTLANLGTIATGTPAGYGVGVVLAAGTVGNGADAVTDALIAGAAIGVRIYAGAGAVTNYGTIAAGTYSAVALQSGGSVTNRPGGLIEGGGDGVAIGYGAGNVTNLGTIIGIAERGVVLGEGGTVENGTSGAGGAAITGGQVGVLLHSGGTVINGQPGSSAASIDGGYYGVRAVYAAADVTNYGTIAGTVAAGIFLREGGTVGNAGGALVTSLNLGITIYGAIGTLDNAGTVHGGNLAVYLGAGGTVTNQQSGVIDGSGGVGIGGLGTVLNLGTITGTASHFGPGVLLDGGGVANGASGVTDALIAGIHRGVEIYSAAGTVTNYGTIVASHIYSPAINLQSGGVVGNRQSGLIEGGGDGIVIGDGVGTVTNLGTIAGIADVGVILGAGGTIDNGASGFGNAAITGGSVGIWLFNEPAGISNYGTVNGGYAGIRGEAGGSIANSGVIAGVQFGADVGGAAGAVVNSGTIATTGASGIGLRLLSGGSIDNAGTITGANLGLYLGSGGSVTNRPSGAIEGGDGVRINLGLGTVANLGTITGTASQYGVGVYLAQGGSVVNGASGVTDALITGSRRAAAIYDAAGTVTNYGTIVATQAFVASVHLDAGGIVTNQQGGLIQGAASGIEINNAGTLINLGTIVATYDVAVNINYGTVTNGTSGLATAQIIGDNVGIAGYGHIINYGTVSGRLFGGIFGGAGTIANSGVIVGGGFGALLQGAATTVVNSGTIAATGTDGIGLQLYSVGGWIDNAGIIEGTRNGVYLRHVAANVTNRGSIIGYTGLQTSDAGSVINYGAITGIGATYGAGVYMVGPGGLVSNYGTIGAAGSDAVGVMLRGGGSIENGALSGTAGSISGGHYGVYVGGAGGTVTNSGTIAGGDAGVVLRGTVEVAVNYGLIVGTGAAAIGVATYAGSTLTNAGTIAGGGMAVAFGGGDDRLIVDPGGGVFGECRWRRQRQRCPAARERGGQRDDRRPGHELCRIRADRG